MKKKRQREIDRTLVLGEVGGAIAAGAWLVHRVVISWPAPIELREYPAAFILALVPLIVSVVFIEVRRAQRKHEKRSTPSGPGR
jgi:hypothetical protein